ncbi:hypothetical protein L6452_33912 [Arctium lappa]|uniref:Uncharacterized protein n=1 Tax=Arctium lappa TaxID=4217 RepID=A0ACB8YHE3_ARCLA|nr:hypothetical protein L6452_33912 [Arctium lappa]
MLFGNALAEGSTFGEVTQEQLDEFEPFSDEGDYYEGDDDEMDNSEDEDYDYIDEEDGITNDEDMINFHLNTDRDVEWVGRIEPNNPVVDVDEDALHFSDD